MIAQLSDGQGVRKYQLVEVRGGKGQLDLTVADPGRTGPDGIARTS